MKFKKSLKPQASSLTMALGRYRIYSGPTNDVPRTRCGVPGWLTETLQDRVALVVGPVKQKERKTHDHRRKNSQTI